MRLRQHREARLLARSGVRRERQCYHEDRADGIVSIVHEPLTVTTEFGRPKSSSSAGGADGSLIHSVASTRNP
jgi:hypothetical protein